MAERGSAESTEGFGVERIARNDVIFREANERIGETAEELGAGMSIPFLCECADENCREIVRLIEVVCECGDAGCVAQIRIASDAYERVRAGATLFIVVPGHETAEIEEIVDKQDAYFIVRKDARVPKRIAEETDPRP